MSEVENQPSVLIVTGMHRSGTSLTAAFLQAIGVDLGDKLLQGNYGNPKGYFEDVDFVESSRGSKRVCLFAPDVTEQKKKKLLRCGEQKNAQNGHRNYLKNTRKSKCNDYYYSTC
jgi:hypothetical protein